MTIKSGFLNLLLALASIAFASCGGSDAEDPDGDAGDSDIPDCQKAAIHHLSACIWGEDEQSAYIDGSDFHVSVHATVIDSGLGEPEKGCFQEPNRGHMLVSQPVYIYKVRWLRLEDDDGFEWMLGAEDPVSAGFPEIGEEVDVEFGRSDEGGLIADFRLNWGEDRFYYSGYSQGLSDLPLSIEFDQPYCRHVDENDSYEMNQVRVSGDTDCYLLERHTYADLAGYRIYLDSQQHRLVVDDNGSRKNAYSYSFSTLNDDSPVPEDVRHAQACPEE